MCAHPAFTATVYLPSTRSRLPCKSSWQTIGRCKAYNPWLCTALAPLLATRVCQYRGCAYKHHCDHPQASMRATSSHSSCSFARPSLDWHFLQRHLIPSLRLWIARSWHVSTFTWSPTMNGAGVSPRVPLCFTSPTVRQSSPMHSLRPIGALGSCTMSSSLVREHIHP